MEHHLVVNDLLHRRDAKVSAHEAHDKRTREQAAWAACEGVDTEALTPGLLKRLLGEEAQK
jgi:hypothetical protein